MKITHIDKNLSTVNEIVLHTEPPITHDVLSQADLGSVDASVHDNLLIVRATSLSTTLLSDIERRLTQAEEVLATNANQVVDDRQQFLERISKESGLPLQGS